MRRLAAILLSPVIIAALTISCTPQPEVVSTPTSPYLEPLKWGPYNLEPNESIVVDGNNTFSCEIYSKLKDLPENENRNLIYSPYSIYLAMAMSYAGARGITAEEMANTMHFSIQGDDLHAAISTVDGKIPRSKEEPVSIDRKTGEESAEKRETFRLSIVNDFWGQQDYEFVKEYLNTIEKYYQGEIRTLDFKHNPEPSRIEINDYIAQQTENRIRDLIYPGAIDIYTRLVITDAIYFFDRWSHQFRKDRTAPHDFNLIGGEKISVPMMNGWARTDYSEGEDYQAVSLPYKGGLSMVVILPSPGKFESFEKSLDRHSLNKILSSMTTAAVKELKLPKFKFSSDYDSFKEVLESLGIITAFTDKADFSGIAHVLLEPLAISSVIHKAFIATDEEGTEAAAATAVGFKVTSPPLPEVKEVTFIADRPFIFLIKGGPGTILFMGRVMDPSEN